MWGAYVIKERNNCWSIKALGPITKVPKIVFIRIRGIGPKYIQILSDYGNLRQIYMFEYQENIYICASQTIFANMHYALIIMVCQHPKHSIHRHSPRQNVVREE